tara:strand:+ start:70 stop:453 length:384 start_codon:yes stop_codon:yes gene_type:complete
MYFGNSRGSIMSIGFRLNRMGVYSTLWYEQNNIPYKDTTKYNRFLGKEVRLREYLNTYCVGRIDISGVINEPYGVEYSVGVMEEGSWVLLGEYLRNLKLQYLPTYKDLITLFETETGEKIKWYHGNK